MESSSSGAGKRVGAEKITGYKGHRVKNIWELFLLKEKKFHKKSKIIKFKKKNLKVRSYVLPLIGREVS